jgi:hypothetical protein
MHFRPYLEKKRGREDWNSPLALVKNEDDRKRGKMELESLVS